MASQQGQSIFWKATNPKDNKRDDLSMYNGRKVDYKSDRLGPGVYEIQAEAVGAGLMALRHVSLTLKVWESGQVILSAVGEVSPKEREWKQTFKIENHGKIEYDCVGVAAHSLKNLKFKTRLMRADLPLASTANLEAAPSVLLKSSQGEGGPEVVRTIYPPVLPNICWSRRLSETFPSHQEFSVTPYEGMRLAGLGLRMKRYIDAETAQGRLPVMNPFKKSPAGPRMGVPLGGIGAGTIGRGWRGDFGRWSILPGFPNYNILDADNFSVYIKRGKRDPVATVLQPTKPSSRKLKKAWNFDISGEKCTNYSLYPQSFTEYNEPDDQISLTCRQVSPFLPHNYKESSYPVGVFEWTIENRSDYEAEVALMFTFQNGIAESYDNDGGHRNISFNNKTKDGSDVVGVELKYNLPTHGRMKKEVLKKKAQNEANLADRFRESGPGPDIRESGGAAEGGAFSGEGLRISSFNVKLDDDETQDPMAFAISVSSPDGNAELTHHSKFLIEGKTDTHAWKARTLWKHFSEHGKLSNQESLSPSDPGQVIGAAVCGKVKVPPGKISQIVFSLAWDVPIVRFNSGAGYFRRYTNFYGRTGQNAPLIATDGLSDFRDWVNQIEKWQTPILQDSNLPDWYKQALFNELYYIVEGGSIWIGERVSDDLELRKNQMVVKPDRVDQETFRTVGRFGYLESLEYIMVNTYDVHFYGSWALIMLFPLLDLSLQADFCNSTLMTHAIEWKTLHSGDKAIRKVKGAVPHDLGNPGDDPWTMVNSYCIQEINSWKDLNSKLVLQVYRDYHVTQDIEFLKQCWPVVQIAVDYVSKFDKDGDGLLENEGFPDQTYDTWSATGPSAYCGGLWVCAMSACEKMAEVLGEPVKAKVFHEKWEKAKKAYHDKLWSGDYYLYDTSDSDHFDSIQADSMCGQWWARASGLPCISEDSCVKSSLKKIFEFNVKKFQCGQIGPINGMKPDGKIDTSCMQSVEVWTGTAYGLASAMMQEGLIEEAFSTAKGIARVTYETVGYMFQTPEAWDTSGNYRALAYMRPLAIWGMQYAWEHGAQQLRPNPNQDLLETELAAEIKALKSSGVFGLGLGSGGSKEKKKALPTLHVVFVGETKTSNIHDLFLACWKRHPVDDFIRASAEGEIEIAGEETLSSGGPVKYKLILCDTRETGKMMIQCKHAAVIVCSYNVANKSSRDWMEKVFFPEARENLPHTPLLMVATGIEIRQSPQPPPEYVLTSEETKAYSIELQKSCPNIRSHVECSPVTFKGFRTLANAGLLICLIGKVKESEKSNLPEAGAAAMEKMKQKDDQNCLVM